MVLVILVKMMLVGCLQVSSRPGQTRSSRSGGGQRSGSGASVSTILTHADRHGGNERIRVVCGFKFVMINMSGASCNRS